MPEYLYGCKGCDVRVIVTRSIQHPEQVPCCYICDQLMSRVYDFGAVTFKGEGFYSNDSK